MANWEEVKDKLEAGGKMVADKAKEIIDIAGMRAQMVSCDTTMSKNFRELGKAYYEAHKDDDTEFADIMTIIKDAAAKKADLEAQLAELKAANAISDDDVEEVTKEVEDAPEEAPAESTFDTTA